jgi:hypothetical protein
VNIDKAILVASEMVKVPKHIMLNGKRLAWGVLTSAQVGRGLIGYFAESLSYSLFDESKVGFAIAIDSENIAGLKMVPDIRLSANDVLLLASASEQLAGPALHDKNFDYSDLLLSFRDILFATHVQGDKVDVRQPAMVSHIFNEMYANSNSPVVNLQQRLSRGI